MAELFLLSGRNGSNGWQGLGKLRLRRLRLRKQGRGRRTALSLIRRGRWRNKLEKVGHRAVSSLFDGYQVVRMDNASPADYLVGDDDPVVDRSATSRSAERIDFRVSFPDLSIREGKNGPYLLDDRRRLLRLSVFLSVFQCGDDGSPVQGSCVSKRESVDSCICLHKVAAKIAPCPLSSWLWQAIPKRKRIYEAWRGSQVYLPT